METPNNVSLDNDVMYEIIMRMDIKTLFMTVATSNSIAAFVNRSYILDALSDVHGLPYVNSINDLEVYALMDPWDLLNAVAESGDMRVLDAVLETLQLTCDDPRPRSMRTEILQSPRMDLTGCKSGYNDAINSAVDAGHIDIVTRFIELELTTPNHVMNMAAWKGNLQIVEHMLDLGANNYNTVATSAVKSGHENIADLMRKFSPNAGIMVGGGGRKGVITYNL